MHSSLIRRLFGSKARLDSAKPAERLSALQSSDLRLDAQQLSLIAREDASVDVRRAAIARLDDVEILGGLLEVECVQDSVAEKLATMVDLPPVLDDHPSVLRIRIRHLGSTEDASRLLTHVGSTESFCQALLACPEAWRGELLPLADTRGEATLTTLEKLSRNHCKTSNRHARSALKEVKRTRDEHVSVVARANEIIAALERVDASHGRQAALLREGEALLGRIATLVENLANYGESGDTCPALNTCIENTRHTAAQASSHAAIPPLEFDTASVDKALDDLNTSLSDQLDVAGAGNAKRALERSLESTAGISDHLRQQAQEALQKAEEAFAAYARLEALPTPPELEAPPEWPREPDALIGLWQSADSARSTAAAAKSAIAKLGWPDWLAVPASTADIEDALKRCEAALERIGAHRQQLEEQLAQAIRDTEAHMEAGELQAARTVFGHARRLDRSVPGHPSHADFGRAAARLQDMSDWAKYATTPKREDLIQRMEDLVSSPREPQVQADTIKQARTEWNTLGEPTGAERALAMRFNELAEAAFEPCRSYYREQADEREQNLVRREEICAQLTSYLDTVDWESADLKAAVQILHTARDEWRAYHPVDRSKGKKLQQRFDTLQERLSERLNSIRNENRQAKEDIVDQARRLADSDDPVDTKVEGAKELQRAWKAVGMTPRNADQKLWKAFRAECDRIFDELSEAQDARTAQRSASADEAERLIDAFVENLTAGRADQAAFNRLRADLDRLGEMPRDREQSLRKHMDTLRAEVKESTHRDQKAQVRQQVEQLMEWDIQVSAAEDAGEFADPPDPVFTRRMEEPTDDAEIVLHRLVVRCEILAGCDSPAHDQSLRLEIQIEKLNQSLNESVIPTGPVEMARQWCEIGPKTEACTSLRERFNTALAEMINQA